MKQPVPHPSTLLPAQTVATLRAHSGEAEALKKLHPGQLQAIYDARWFKMFVPATYGGLEFSLPEVLQHEEALAWVDGSVAWVVTLCSGAGWFVGFLNADIADERFHDNVLCLAGSGAPTGIAEVNDRGYTVRGQWKYASGAEHATAFTANCVVHKDGVPQHDETGAPQIASFIFLRHEVTLHHTWHTMGMMATGSHAFSVDGLHVHSSRRFFIDARHAVLRKPVYQYPFLPLAETTLAVNLLGMAMRFVELAEALLAKKSAFEHLKKIADTRALLDATRQDFYDAAIHSWETLLALAFVDDTSISRVSEVSHRVVRVARLVVNEVYPLCGLGAADTPTEINRVWRNFHTASQHALFNKP